MNPVVPGAVSIQPIISDQVAAPETKKKNSWLEVDPQLLGLGNEQGGKMATVIPITGATGPHETICYGCHSFLNILFTKE